MKSSKVLVAIVLTVIFAVFATSAFATPLGNGSLLALDPGAGSAANVPCATGSCFGMYQGPGLILWTDFAPGTDGGIVFGKEQQPGELSDYWSFFGALGSFSTVPYCPPGYICIPESGANKFDNTSCYDAASCLGKTTLGTWNVDWNGLVVPVGSAQGCLTTTPANCVGVSLWTLNPDPAATGSVFELNYAWAVPDGDPSGFGNVPFYLVLRGVVTVVNPCADAATRCNDNNACTSDLCDPVTGACIHTPAPNGTACTSTNKCLVAPLTCNAGVCGGTAKVCNDNNACTTDTCTTSTGVCKFTPISGGTCNDNNACTLNDTCVSGICKGTTRTCSDYNPCSTDTCDTATGVCSNTPGPQTCGLPCDSTTAPGMALLPAGTILQITQGVGSGINIPCSVGSCFSMETAPGTLTWIDFGPGTDGGIVVGKAQKSGGQELGASATGNTPGELSNVWSFFSAYGTFFTVPGGDTQDTYCNTACSGADCIYKTELKVFNVAWNGTIIPMGSAAGCTHSNCTTAQKEGIFVNSWTVQGGAWSMNYSQVVPSGSFTGVKFTAILRGMGTCICPDDGNPCTDDACVNGVCQHTPRNCNDNNLCTTDSCDTATGACVHTYISGCDPQCAGKPNGMPCMVERIWIDPSVCYNDYCSNGVCVMNEHRCDDNNSCTTDTCNTASGVCVYTVKNCNDNNICTTDSCDAITGTCIHTLISPTCGLTGTPLAAGTKLGITQGLGSGANIPCTAGSCFGMEVSPGYVVWSDFGPGTDGGFVVGKDQADGALSNSWMFFSAPGTFNTTTGGSTNLFDSAPCSGAGCLQKTELKVFNATWNGNVIPMGSAGGCTLSTCSTDQKAGIFVNDWQIDPVDGGAWCITYSQVVPSGSFAGVKFFLRVCGTMSTDPCVGVICNDNNACTTDTCNPSTGACVHTPVSCPLDFPCDPADGLCKPMPCIPADCDDNNACTTDTCEFRGVCVHTPIVCNDNNACTTDSCNSVIGCIYTPVICNDNNACTTDTCDPSTGCVHYAVNVNDNDACTIDTCNPATGAVFIPVNCDDNNACTADTCNSATGCVHTLIVCNDNNQCTTDSCDAVVGCMYTALPDQTACTLDSQPGSCAAGLCIPYPACPAGSVKNVVVRGGGQKPSGADLQIQTSFTVMNAGCIVDSSASSLTCSAGTILQVNVNAGQGPQPVIGIWEANPIPTDTNFMITCTAGQVYKLDLDNKDAPGGKDVDRITINVQ